MSYLTKPLDHSWLPYFVDEFISIFNKFLFSVFQKVCFCLLGKDCFDIFESFFDIWKWQLFFSSSSVQQTEAIIFHKTSNYLFAQKVVISLNTSQLQKRFNWTKKCLTLRNKFYYLTFLTNWLHFYCFCTLV